MSKNDDEPKAKLVDTLFQEANSFEEKMQVRIWDALNQLKIENEKNRLWLQIIALLILLVLVL